LRVPGVGPIVARKLVLARRANVFRGLSDLRKLGVVVSRAAGFNHAWRAETQAERWLEQLGLWEPEQDIGARRRVYEFSPGHIPLNRRGKSPNRRAAQPCSSRGRGAFPGPVRTRILACGNIPPSSPPQVPRKSSQCSLISFGVLTIARRPHSSRWPSACPAVCAAGHPHPRIRARFVVGADYKLATYDESIRYFQRLAASSDRIKLVEVGKTSFGHGWTLAIISSAQNLAKLDHYPGDRAAAGAPGGPHDEEAHRLAHAGKAFVEISGGLHASEIAGRSTRFNSPTTWRRPRIRKTLQMLDQYGALPRAGDQSDGQTSSSTGTAAVVERPTKVSPLHELYQKYIGHDNNRDAYMLT